MSLKNKIIKYRTKKNKIIQKINLLLKKKINENENYLSNVTNHCVKNISSNLTNSNNLIIVTGTNGCGKTTLINHIEKYKKINNFKYINISAKKNISNAIELLNSKFKNFTKSDSIITIIIEINLFDINELLEKLNLNLFSNTNYYLWKLEPINKIMYKHKIINKIFSIIRSKTNIAEFVEIVDKIDNSIIPNKTISKKFIEYHINNIKIQQNKILYENNFDFVDEIVQILISQSVQFDICDYNFINSNFINI